MEALQQLLFNTAPLKDMPIKADYRIKNYAIVDCASDEQHYQQLLGMDIKHAILYKDEDAKNLETVAPYLIELDPEHDYTQWLLKEQWGTHSVVYIKSHYSLEQLALHFQRYTKVVIDPREQDDHILASEAFFAFYDPRVLKNYFGLLTKEQMTEFCQPVICFSYEDEDLPDLLLTSYLKKTGDQWGTLATSLDGVELTEQTEKTGKETTEAKAELDDHIEVPIMPVILTAAQQDAFEDYQRQQFCNQLLNDLQYHYDVSLDDEEDAIRYLKEAEKIGLQSEATQSRYILTALLIKYSPVAKSKHLKQSLKLDVDEHARMKTLDKALEELSMHKEQAYVR